MFLILFPEELKPYEWFSCLRFTVSYFFTSALLPGLLVKSRKHKIPCCYSDQGSENYDYAPFSTCHMFLKIKFYWKTDEPFLQILSMVVFMLQQQRWLVVTEAVWPPKPKIFTIWFFSEKANLPMPDLNKCHDTLKRVNI